MLDSQNIATHCATRLEQLYDMQIFPGLSQGYSTYDPVKEVPNLQGKVVLVTGAKYVGH